MVVHLTRFPLFIVKSLILAGLLFGFAVLMVVVKTGTAFGHFTSPATSHLLPRMMQHFSRTVMKILGMKIVFHWEEKSAALTTRELNTPVIIANHVSYLDIFAICSQWPARFVAKGEVADWPLIGAMARQLGTLFVGRQRLSSRVTLLRRLAQHPLPQATCLFPEGTTTPSGLPHRNLWRPGFLHIARAQQKKIVALGIAYAPQAKIAWVGSSSLFPHLLRLIWLGRGEVFLTASLLDSHADAALSPRDAAEKIRQVVLNNCFVSHRLAYQSSLQITQELSTTDGGNHEFDGVLASNLR